MKSKLLWLSFAVISCLLLPTRGCAQGCVGVMTPEYSTYNSSSFDSSDHIYSSVSVDGYTLMGNTEYCPAAKTAIHTPRAYNVLSTMGGWINGNGAPAASYISVTNPEEIVGIPGVVYYNVMQTRVICSDVGSFYSAYVSDYAEIATTDVTGGFCTSGSEREFTLEGSWYADEEIQARADRNAATAD